MRVRVVLVRPRYAGNIGAALRVAANFAVPEVVLVAPSCPPDDIETTRMAMGALEHLVVTETAELAAAVGDAELVVATTSLRYREPRGVITLPELREQLGGSAPPTCALVFGPERGGLSRSEMRLAHLRLSVRTNPRFPVLNLAQAVGIVLAGVLADSSPAPTAVALMDDLAPLGELADAVSHLERVMLASGFLDPANPARVTDQLRRWFGRTVPTRREVALLHALAAHIAYLLDRGQKPIVPNA